MSEKPRLTPLLEQYFAIRQEHPDALLLFQVGDFYELFFQDAQTASQVLAITLTKRGKFQDQDIPICGVPVSSLNHHLIKLVKAGLKVAICQQVSPPIPGQVVERKVTQVLTPGTLTDQAMLEDKRSSYLCAFWPGGNSWTIVFTEMLSARVFATQFIALDWRSLEAQLARFVPDEIVMPAHEMFKDFKRYFAQCGYSVNVTGALKSEQEFFLDQGLQHFVLQNNDFLQNYLRTALSDHVWLALQANADAACCMAVLASYLYRYHRQVLSEVATLEFYDPDQFLTLDAVTLKNLEVVRNCYDGSVKNTLLEVVDQAATVMGSRELRKMLLFPLQNLAVIQARMDAVGVLSSSLRNISKLGAVLKRLPDLERIVGRIALGRAILADYLALSAGLDVLQELRVIMGEILQQSLSSLLTDLIDQISDFSDLQTFLQQAFDANGSNNFRIKKGFDVELDQLIDLVEHGQQKILALEREEVERTGIKSLKICYTDIAGFFIQVTKTNVASVPTRYVCLQNLTGYSRYTTDELLDLQEKIFLAREKIGKAEQVVFDRACRFVQGFTASLRKAALSLARIDALFGLARLAYQNRYVRPSFVSIDELVVEQGRHPVVENSLAGNTFVANDTVFSPQHFTFILTGPNMGGKSTYLRQVAHIVILAHMGSFVPAAKCRLRVFDRIFTRLGSGDNLAAGKSTFLVEMEEAASICLQATERSLIVLDEVGRGTSTYDGMAIAQAIVEFLTQKVRAKTLFATHYHELTALQALMPGVENFFLDSRMIGDKLVFLHKVKAGAAAQSFGLAVARLAGLPDEILLRAKVLLHDFKTSSGSVSLPVERVAESNESSLANNILAELASVDLDNISFRQAFAILEELVLRSRKE